MKRYLFVGLALLWGNLIRLKRVFLPRPFRAVRIFRRCPGCGRRLREAVRAGGVPGICGRCTKSELRKLQARQRGGRQR